MRIWAKIFKENRMIKDFVYINNDEDTRTHKVFTGLEEACHEFDLQNPIWLDVNVRDFKKFSRTRFSKDSFIEEVDFDYLEFQILEEDGQDIY